MPLDIDGIAAFNLYHAKALRRKAGLRWIWRILIFPEDKWGHYPFAIHLTLWHGAKSGE